MADHGARTYDDVSFLQKLAAQQQQQMQAKQRNQLSKHDSSNGNRESSKRKKEKVHAQLSSSQQVNLNSAGFSYNYVNMGQQGVTGSGGHLSGSSDHGHGTKYVTINSPKYAMKPMNFKSTPGSSNHTTTNMTHK